MNRIELLGVVSVSSSVRRTLALAAAGVAVGILAGAEARAQNILPYGASGQVYTQDFNTLPFVISNGAFFQNNVGNTNAATFSNYNTFQAANRPNAVINYAAQSWTTEVYTSSNTLTGLTAASLTATPAGSVLTTTTAGAYATQATTALQGWGIAQTHATGAGPTPQVPRFIVDNGTSATGSARSFGSNSFVRNDQVFSLANTNTQIGTLGTSPNPATFGFQDRALGMVASGTGINAISLTLRNDSVTTMTTLSLRFFIEQWRRGNTAIPPGDIMPFAFSVTNDEPADPTADLTGTSLFTNVATFNLTSVASGNTTAFPINSAMDGNLAGNRRLINDTMPIQWEPGQFLTLRWRDTDSNGNDDGLGLDDITVVATGVTIPGGTPVLTWTGAASSNVNTTEVNFDNGSGAVAFSNNSVVNFTSSGVGTRPSVVIDAGGIGVFQTNVSNDGDNYTISGGRITSADGLNKTGGGTLTLRNVSNDFGTPGLKISGGTVNFTDAAQLGVSTNGAAGRVVMGANTTLEADGAAPVGPTGAVVLNGSGITLRTIAPSLTISTLNGSGAFTKTGAGTLRLNGLVFSGGVTIDQGTLVLAPAGGTSTLRVDGPFAGDLVIATPFRLNISNTLSSPVSSISGGGKIYVDASGATLATSDNAQSFYEINNEVVLNRNNTPGFVFNLFPGFAGGQGRIVVNGLISGNSDLNFASGPANGSGNVVINTPLQHTGRTTINVIGATSNNIGGQPVILGVNNAFPVTTTLGFNTATGFTQGSSGTGRLEMGFQRTLTEAVSYSQTVAGLFSGTGDAPQNSFANVGSAFGTVGNNVSGTDPITTVFTVNVATGQSYTYKGQLRRLMSFVKDGAGTQELSAQFFFSNTPSGAVQVGGTPQTSNYTGTTEIRAGILRASVADNRLSPESPLEFGSVANNTAGRLELVGVNQEVIALASVGTSTGHAIVNTGTNAATFTVRSQDLGNTAFFANDRYRQFQSTTYSGAISDGPGVLSVVKTATVTTVGGSPENFGQLTLSGSLSYSGNTTVLGGRLIAKSPIAPLSVNPATTLGSVSASGAARLTIDIAAGTSSPVVVLNASSISVSNNALLDITPVTRAGPILHVALGRTLSIATGGHLDLGNSDLIVRNGNLASVRSLVSNWYAGGLRNGLGLGASGASEAGFTTLAVFPNQGADVNTPYYGTYAGIPLGAADVLVRYTYVGDTNIDGVIDANDLTNLIEGFTTGQTGWQWGDLDYSGAVDVADWALFNAVYSVRGTLPSLGSPASLPTSGGAIPEPSAALPLLVAALPLTRRRRSR